MTSGIVLAPLALKAVEPHAAFVAPRTLKSLPGPILSAHGFDDLYVPALCCRQPYNARALVTPVLSAITPASWWSPKIMTTILLQRVVKRDVLPGMPIDSRQKTTWAHYQGYRRFRCLDCTKRFNERSRVC